VGGNDDLKRDGDGRDDVIHSASTTREAQPAKGADEHRKDINNVFDHSANTFRCRIGRGEIV
jgi:hypothetical protein